MAVWAVALCTDHGCTYYVAVYLLELWPSSCKPYAFQVYLRSIASKHVQGEVNAADIERDVKRRFGIDLTGKLAELQEPMHKSRVCTALDSHVLPCLPRQKHTYVLQPCALYGHALRTANCTAPLPRLLSRTTAFSNRRSTARLWPY